MKVELDELMTGAELARRLDISRARLHQLAARPDFPAPLGQVGRAKVWDWTAVAAWAERTGRLNK